MTAAELRARAIKLLTSVSDFTRPTPEAIALADVWARLSVSAAIEETGKTAAIATDRSGGAQ